MSSILRSLLISTNCESYSDIMYENSNGAWLDFIETYKNFRQLWDPKHTHYLNKRVRAQAREKLLAKFKKIDEDATMKTMVKRLGNMRTSYNRERKKVMESIQKGGSPHIPTLWYYDHFHFLDQDKETGPYFNTIRHFRPPLTNLKRQSSEELNSSENAFLKTSERINGIKDEEDIEVAETQPPPPKRRIYHLLQKQEKFIDTAGKMLVRQEKDWEVLGKAIGLQLEKLEDSQRTIADKLIADLVYYGSLGKLTTDSYIHIEDVQRLSPEMGQIEALEDFDDSSCEAEKEIFYVDSNDEDE